MMVTLVLGKNKVNVHRSWNTSDSLSASQDTPQPSGRRPPATRPPQRLSGGLSGFSVHTTTPLLRLCTDCTMDKTQDTYWTAALITWEAGVRGVQNGGEKTGRGNLSKSLHARDDTHHRVREPLK